MTNKQEIIIKKLDAALVEIQNVPDRWKGTSTYRRLLDLIGEAAGQVRLLHQKQKPRDYGSW